MRVSESEQISDRGVQQVKAELTDLGWNAIEVPKPGDVGTDLYVQIFDERRHALRLVLGVQVKSGASYFSRSRKYGEDGELLGWWYSEDDSQHFDYWTTHALPHLLVLRDIDRGVSYWVHVTAERVERTGHGKKIFVRCCRTISSDQVNDLVKVAASQKAAPLLEGLAFSAGVNSLPQVRRLRFALIVPRLVVPLRSAGFENAICAEEAIGLISHGRFRDLKEFAEAHDEVPDPDQTGDDASWLWQFAATFWDWAINDSLDRLRRALATAPDDCSRAASGVLLACALRRIEKHSDSMAVLNSLVERDSLDPVDRGWALVQRARNKTEIGDLEGAHADALEAQRSFAGDHDDITVSVLRASAAWTLYHAASMRRYQTGEIGSNPEVEQGRYNDLLIAFDTAVSWWRSQGITSALSTEQDESFRAWTQDDSVKELIFGSSGHDELFAAELNADLTADHGAWRAAAERRGRRQLMRASQSDDEIRDLVEGLDTLRRSGQDQSLGLAIGHLLRVGPTDALSRSLRSVPITGWTSTTVAANLGALKLAGDFLPDEIASELLLSCTRIALGDAAELPQCNLTVLGLTGSALEAAACLVPAADNSLHSQIARDLAALPRNTVHAYFPGFENILHQLEWDHVEPPAREGLRELARCDSTRLTAAVLGVLVAAGDVQSQTELRCLAATGDLYAVSALAHMSDLSDSQAGDLLGALCEQARNVLENARGGSHSSDSPWLAEALMDACAASPRRACWDDVIGLLTDRAVDVSTKRALCAGAVRFADRLPADVREGFASNIDQVEQSAPAFWGGTDCGGIQSRLLYALGAVSGSEAEEAMVDLAVGTHLERCDAVHLAHDLDSDRADLVLSMLARDRDFSVRRTAAYCIGHRIAKSESRTLDAAAWEMAHSDGTVVQLVLLNGLKAADVPRRRIVVDIAHRLKMHPAARVRRRADRLESDAPLN